MLKGLSNKESRILIRLPWDSMTSNVNPLAGQPALTKTLVDVTRLLANYYDRRPDPNHLLQTNQSKK
jgi:hypothetical protein